MLRGTAFGAGSRVAVRPSSSSRASTVVVRAVQDLKGKVSQWMVGSCRQEARIAFLPGPLWSWSVLNCLAGEHATFAAALASVWPDSSSECATWQVLGMPLLSVRRVTTGFLLLSLAGFACRL